MTLRFFNNQGKPDTRKIEYDQAIVQAGLEKAQLEAEVERKRNELKNLNIACDPVRNVFRQNQEKLEKEQGVAVQNKVDELKAFDDNVTAKRSELALLETKRNVLEKHIEEKNQDLSSLSVAVSEANDKKLKVESEVSAAEEERSNRRRRIADMNSEFNAAKDNLEIVREDLVKAGRQKIEIDEAVRKANKDLEELNNIISILQTTNKQGLDIVASFEGERKRLQEKEEFLKRKEADLLIYENRLKKHCIKVGYDVEMIFK